ncbi:MAG TPA: ABC transporter ATP-binding protein [Myxococcota bacterium]|nr:ABC transporter ATP-binding protein [Myxococcota bacterium]
MNAPRLRIAGVALRLGARCVLAGVDLDVAPGEVVGLLGRNGAGKTTLLRVAAGLATPDAGTVALDGRPLAALGRRERARAVALVPQETHFPFPYSVAEVVLMGRAPHLGWLGFERRHDLDTARAAMTQLGIDALAERSVLALSGGERQLTVVARALAQEPRLLLLDEPTAFLDLRHRLEVLARVRAFAAGGGAALVVSHDLGVAARACDRLALLAGGRIVAAGLPSEVLTPALLREAFAIEADVLTTADGHPVVVPRPLASSASVRGPEG